MAKPPGDAARPRSVAALVAAVVLVVGVAAGVLLFGVQRPPDLPDLADSPQPGPQHRIAWVDHTGGETCLRVAMGDGAVTEPWCGEPGGDLVGWDADGRVLLQAWDVEPTVRVVDPETGASTTRPVEEDADLWHTEEPVPPRREDEELVVQHEGVEVWRTEAPPAYEITTRAASPDGDWLALIDTADRLLVVRTDGSGQPRVWAREVSAQVPAWEE